MKTLNKDINWLIFGILIVVVNIIYTVRSPVTWLLWLCAVLAYIILTKHTTNIGVTKVGFKEAFIASFVIAVVYGILRALILIYVSGSEYIFGAGLTETVEAMKIGRFPIGDISGTALKIFLVMLVTSAFTVVMWESFFRGFLFNKMKLYIHWAIAIVIIAILSGLPHSESFSGFSHSIILGLIAGLLMQKYNNVIAPIMFHFLHFQVALVILWIYNY